MDKLNSFKVKNLYTDGILLENQEIEIQNNVIVSLKSIIPNSEFDYENLASALVDIHINGGEDLHFTSSPTLECLADIENAAAKNGTGYVLPTLITSTIDNIFQGLESIKNYLIQNPDSGVLGMHLEGPFLNVKKRGAHLEKYLLKPDDKILKEIIDFGGEYLKMITIAPELFTAKQLQYLLDSGVQVSIGHSNATFKEAENAFKIGANLVTHLYNAMSAFGHREVGLIGASLLNNEVYAPIIADDIHVSPEALKTAYRMKNDKLFLISDALFQNYKKKKYVWEEFDANLVDNKYVNSEGNLAGGTLSLGEIVKNAQAVLQIPTEKVIAMATSLPAEMIKENYKYGSVKAGYRASFCTFDNDLSNFKLIKNII